MPTTTPNPSKLTRRELEVLNLIVAGKTDNAIADELFISRPTASNHVTAIRRKFGVTSRTAAAAIAVRWGIAVPDIGPPDASGGMVSGRLLA